MDNMPLKIFLLVVFTVTLSSLSLAAPEKDLFSLSLRELSNIKINTGGLFGKASKEAPSPITVIDSAKIELSGAKNLANLLEQYVPGLMVMSHSEGDKIGLRGNIAAENYKLLLLVNGKNVTNMVYEGVITEIDQWELGDIDRVEVVSGPGSVTYGTGAIAGVINIITKKASSDMPTWSVGLSANDKYRSQGLNLQYSNNTGDWGVYAFASLRESDGYKRPNYFVLNPSEPTDNRYLGKASGANAPPQNYLADSFDRPQVKMHMGLSKGDSFNTWLRYTQSGQTRAFREQIFKQDSLGNDTEAIDGSNLETRSLVASGDYRIDYGDNTALSTSFTYDTQEYIRYRFDNRQLSESGTNNIRQYAFSQNRITASALYEFEATESFDIITGYEYTNIHVGAPWGKNDNYLWIKEGVDIISSNDTSIYLQNPRPDRRPDTSDSVEVGSGLRFETHSQLLETKWTFSEKNVLYYAHRLDIPDVADTMFSPRLSLVNNIDSNQTLVSTLQRAQRMMPLRAQYLNDRAGNSSKLETLDNLEFSYTNTSLDNSTFVIRAYYNQLEAVGFTGANLDLLADIDLYGLEFSIDYKKNNFEFNFNHAFLEPADIEFNDDLKTGDNRNNISFADYFYNVDLGLSSGDQLELRGFGNGLNNWSTNISKLSLTQSFMNQSLKAHVNMQIHWDYDGAYDEMGMYQRAYNNIDRSSLSVADQAVFDQRYQEFLREKDLLEDEDGYELDYNVNASITYLLKIRPATELKFKLFAENIFKSSYRYDVSTGSSNYYPNRLRFLKKPRVLGASVQINF